MPILRVVDGQAPLSEYEIEDDRLSIGRDPRNAICLDHQKISRNHAEFVRVGNDYYLVDCNSRNGTRLNGKPVKPGVRYPLRFGDTVAVSGFQFTYVDAATEGGTFAVCPDAVVVDDASTAPPNILSRLACTPGGLDQLTKTNAETKLQAIMEITRELQEVLALDDVFDRVLDSLLKLLPQTDRAVIVLRKANQDPVPAAVRLRGDDEDRVRVSRTIVDHVLQNCEAILSHDAVDDPRFAQSRSVDEYAGRSLLVAPLVDREGAPFGVVQIDARNDSGEYDDEDLDLFVSVTLQMAMAIDNTRLHERALRQEAIRRDVELAREVQLDLLPSRPPDVEGFSFYDFYAPARDVGGDYYDYVRLDDGRLAVVCADVSGKGVAAALVSTILCSEIRAYFSLGRTASEVMTRINGTIHDRTPERCFVTMVLTVLDPRTGDVEIVNAGHWCPLLRRPNGDVVDVGDEEAGFPIGTVDDYEYEHASVTLQSGESLVLFSDGVVDAMNLQQEVFGPPRLRALVGLLQGSATDVGQAIMEEVQSFVGNARQTDDICLVCVSRD